VTRTHEQAVLATVRLVGTQNVAVTVQHGNTTEAVVTVRIGKALLYLHDEVTATHFHHVWHGAATHAQALPLQADRDLVRALRGMPEPGIVANAVARPQCSVVLVAENTKGRRPFLRIQLGRIAFEIRDVQAYRTCLAAFHQARALAHDMFIPPGTERVLRGAGAAARDAFYPETPPRPADRRHTRLVTPRSAPIPPASPVRASPAPRSSPREQAR
jgi:hypothetical protein